jgi:hypothetical protein
VFEGFYGKPRPVVTGLKSVVIGRALLDKALRARARRGLEPVRAASRASSPQVVYQFYLRSLARTVRAFRETNPNVRIVLSSLVARWPMESVEAFRGDRNLPDALNKPDIGPAEAAALLKPFNALIEQFARDNGILFVDMAAAFEHLERPKLLWDHAHMYEDGYRIMAHVFYRSLLEAGLLEGRPNPELETLLSKYARVRLRS